MAGLLWYRSYMDSLANTSGYYPDIHAGHADRVAELTLEAPYLVRDTPAGYNQLELMELVGGSVAWNQICSLWSVGSTATVNGVTRTVNADGSYTFTNTATANANLNYDSSAFKFTANHVYFLHGASGGSSNTYQNVVTGYNAYTRDDALFKPATDKTEHFRLVVTNGVTVNLTFSPYVTDLTQMLGPTIADYVYSLEQATAGSGVQWLKNYGFFTEDYIPHSAPTLQSVEATAHVTKDANDTAIATYPLDSDLVLRGIPKLTNGNLYYDGDTYEWDGTVTRKYAEVALSDLTWTLSGQAASNFTAVVPDKAYRSGNVNLFICDKYELSTASLSSMANKSIRGRTDNNRIYVQDNSYADAASFSSAVAGSIVYELATQTTESADPFTAVQTVEDGGTEEFVTTNNVPVGNVSIYRRV